MRSHPGDRANSLKTQRRGREETRILFGIENWDRQMCKSRVVCVGERDRDAASLQSQRKLNSACNGGKKNVFSEPANEGEHHHRPSAASVLLAPLGDNEQFTV